MQLNSITPAKSNQWLKIALILLVVIFISLAAYFYFSIFKSQKGSNFFVNANYRGYFKYGSEKYPFKNVSQALAAASKKKTIPTVYVKNGEYNEKIDLPEGAVILGESRDGVILRGDRLLPIITMKNNSSVYNLSTVGGSEGILAEGRAIIEDCSITGFKEKGIGAIPSSEEIVVRNSEIFGGDNKGVYIQKGRKIEITGNKIHNNHGEGLDIRDKISGVIDGNEIYGNSESGMEIIVGGSDLDIKNNNIWDNEASGVVFQYYEDSPEKGSIVIHGNRIKSINSEEYTISVKSPSGGEGRVKNYWRDSVIIKSDNVLEGEIKIRSLSISK